MKATPYSRVLLGGVLFCLTSAAHAATFNVALNYNFNGIVHQGESGDPDAPGGYRSISDRGLDFTGGVPSDSLLDKYTLVSSSSVNDIVHLGNRNTVDVGGPGNGAFDAVADGDNIGTQPSWLPTVDQSGPQTTVLPSGLLLDGSSSASFIYQISNGGGTFDIVFAFAGGGSYTATLSGQDWFNGDYAGTDGVDQGNLGANNLKIEEGVIDLSGSAGETLESISFQNRSNTNAGYAILAANIEAVPEPASALLAAMSGLLVFRRRRG